jgi:ectoine hydroxylase-related dioxygenase (phytanoyl-CoA dioxygenase family)
MTETSAVARTFDAQGYVHVPGFFTEDEIGRVRDEIERTGQTLERQSRLNAGSMIFLNNLHRQNQLLQDFVCQDRLVAFLAEVMGPDFWIRWDQCVCKGPGAPEFPWHQDNAYNTLKDPHFQLWIAVSPTTADNGGLWLAPGSHKRGLVPHHKRGTHQVADETPADPVLIEAARGDIVLFSSLMLHYTGPNVSTNHRWAYVVEYMKSEHLDPYVESPYMIVAENGHRVQRMAASFRGSRDLRALRRYFGLRGAVSWLARDARMSPD